MTPPPCETGGVKRMRRKVMNEAERESRNSLLNSELSANFQILSNNGVPAKVSPQRSPEQAVIPGGAS
jgi:hypothetical protein